VKLTDNELVRTISALSIAIATTEKVVDATEFKNLRTKYERTLRSRKESS
jgi:hypothetical protein